MTRPVVENLKLWFRIVYGTLISAIDGLNRFVHYLHDEARTHEDPKQPTQYDPKHAQFLREQANRFAQTAEELRRATEAGIKDQPGDEGSTK